MTEPAPLWVVLPTYNERNNVERIVPEIRARLPQAHKILIVDDSSPDGTGEIADRVASESDDVEVMHRPRKEGLGPAYLAGFRRALAAGAELIVEMDADFSHDPEHLPQLLEAARGADLVLGSRYAPGGGVADWGALRRLISRGGSAYARLMLGLRVRDLTGGFKVFHRRVLEAIDLDSIRSRGYAFQVETTYRALKRGFRVVEVPIVFSERTEGSSKMSRTIFAEAVWRVPVMRLRRRWMRAADG